MGLPLVTLEEYKTYVGITSTNLDTKISSLIPIVSQIVKTICGRAFIDYVDDAKTEVSSGGWSKILLAEEPLLSISSVEFSEDYGNTYTELVEFTDYVVDREDNSIRRIGNDSRGYPLEFTKCTNGYKVTYYAGYEELPSDLKVATLDLLTYYIKNDSSVHSPKAPGTNTVQIEYITNVKLPAHISRVLDLYTASFN